MSEPDFDQLAQTLIHEAAMVVGALQAGTDCLPARRSIDELLRQVWNARGAADRVAMADLLLMQPSNICEPVQYTLRKLDR